jgi:hypothetical protein
MKGTSFGENLKTIRHHHFLSFASLHFAERLFTSLLGEEARLVKASCKASTGSAKAGELVE